MTVFYFYRNTIVFVGTFTLLTTAIDCVYVSIMSPIILREHSIESYFVAIHSDHIALN